MLMGGHSLSLSILKKLLACIVLQSSKFEQEQNELDLDITKRHL